MTAEARMPVLDQIRGVALFGILLVNVQSYTLFLLLTPTQVYALGIDTPSVYPTVQFLVSVLVQGQFFTLYSFLFGLGFHLILQKCERLGLEPRRVMRRRLESLLVLGLFHGCFLWFGDILHRYALLGFSLFYFHRQSTRTLVRWIVGLVLAFLAFQVALLLWFPRDVSPGSPFLPRLVSRIVTTWQHGSVTEVLSFQMPSFIWVWLNSAMNGLPDLVHIEIMFLLGILAGRRRLLQNVDAVRPIVRRVVAWIAAPGLILKGLSQFYLIDEGIFSGGEGVWIRTVCEFLAIPLVAIVYLWALTELFLRVRLRLFDWIGHAGRLALTNYLGQTLICMVLFYGCGFGLSGRLTLIETLAVACLIYAFQVVFSTLWVRYVGIGPCEAYWRKWTYAKQDPQSPLSRLG